jgi:hypothetical protein
MSILIPSIIFVFFFSIMIWQKYRSSQEMPVVPLQPETASVRSGALFFAVDGTRLVREAREFDSCDDDASCVKNVLDELLNGPINSEFEETIPEGVVVSSVRIEGNQATVGFNSLFFEAMPSGSSAEMLAVYSVVNTIAVNFPQIQKVKVEVEGNTDGVLRHLDISEPLLPDYSLELSSPSASEKQSTHENSNRKGEHR